MKKRKIIIWSIAIMAAIIALIAVCDIFVAMNASGKTYDEVDRIPHRKVGLILGTSPISTWNGRRNYYFDHRIKAGADLYNAAKVIGSLSVAAWYYSRLMMFETFVFVFKRSSISVFNNGI